MTAIAVTFESQIIVTGDTTLFTDVAFVMDTELYPIIGLDQYLIDRRTDLL